MKDTIIADTGPLVAYLDRSDCHHEWAKARMALMTQPLMTCESVMSEAWHLLRRGRINPSLLLSLVSQGALVVSFDFMKEAPAVRALVQKYHDVPMSLADACLVRMTESVDHPRVFTVDSDFHVYRRHGKKAFLC